MKNQGMDDPIPPGIRKAWEEWNIRGTILLSLSLQILLILLAPFRKSTRQKLLIVLIWSAYLLADATANFTVGLISKSQDENSERAAPSPGSSPAPSLSISPEQNEDLLAFWAPFLLLHLGGPDTITAFALEDNELWLRHLLALGFQALAALYVFVQSIPNGLWIPVTLMFVAGTIKYVERTRALYLASVDRFRDSMLKEADAGPNYAKLMEEYAFKRENILPTEIIMIPEPDKEARATDVPVKEGQLNDLEVVHYAYKYFLIFRGLVADLIFSFRERNESREFFTKRDPDDALRVIEVELNLIYEVLFTKVQVVHSIWGYIFRGITFGSILASLGLFHFKTMRHKFNIDVRITYTLLLGAIALDVIAFLMLIFSDWMFATIKDPDSNSGIFAKIFGSFLLLKRPWWRKCECEIKNPKLVAKIPFKIDHHVLATPILFRRWSGSLSSYNLISYCLKSHTSKIHKFERWPRVIAEKIDGFLHIGDCYHFVVKLIKTVMKTVTNCLSGATSILAFVKQKVSKFITFLVDKLKLHHIIRKTGELFSYIHRTMAGSMGLKGFLDELIYVSREPFTKELWEFVFKELKNKADYADDPETAQRISAAKGEWVLVDSDTKVDRSTLMQYVSDVQYDESLLLWHIATDLCYYTPVEQRLNEESYNYREFSKLLSDYMLYLLIMQPTMMAAVGGIGKIRFRDTCAEAERFFRERSLLSKPENKKKRENVKNAKEPSGEDEEETENIVEAEACKEILLVTTDVKPVTVKGDRSKSVLFDASMLAQELNRLEEVEGLDKWKLVSRVWVELISYAASHCRANAHAQQLSKGGELITFIWLLMAHFGLGDQFQINEGHARAKLIVGK
ncbi:hypothetical protein DITRI_Ditri07aG0177100 [Diplodiscus trichospermus]